jgi:hypothetical protein
VPTDNVAVLKVAVVTPPVVLTFTGLPVLPSITNWTVPVGVPGELSLIVAVNVTVWPEIDGLAEELTAVLVAALPTV